MRVAPVRALPALLGGAIWAAHALLIARRPEGCVGDACASGVTPRPTEDLAWPFLVAVVLIAVAATILSSGERFRGRALIRAGTVLVVAGAAALAAGIVVNAVIVGDSPLWWLHDSDSLGRLLPVAGSLFVGFGVLRSRRLAPWAGAALAVGAVVSLGFNAQDERVLLTVPLALAWVAVGYAAARRAT